MSSLKNLAKGGWHPKGKDGNGESFRGDMKGVNQVASWVGKGKPKGSAIDQAKQHHSAPLSTLKDPALFGPPPKHIHAHGPGAVPDRLTPDTSGWGGPVTINEHSAPRDYQQDEESEQEEQSVESSYPPRAPYRVETGLSTSQASQLDRPAAAATPAPPPPPPRLPPRQNSQTSSTQASSPPASTSTNQPHSDYLNAGAVNRLGRAGISVPGFNIGQGKNGTNERAPTAQASPDQLNELQSRFSRIQTPSSLQSNATPSQGTTWAQKQNALRTATNLKKDPSSVSLDDARSTASTVRNFQQRHGEQMASGLRAANSINQKYGVSDKLGGLNQNAMNAATDKSQEGRMIGSSNNIGSAAATAATKKPPPVPPPKKKNLLVEGNAFQALEPPPIPLASKPK